MQFDWRRFFGKSKTKKSEISSPVQGDVSVIIKAIEKSHEEFSKEPEKNREVLELLNQSLEIWRK